MRTNKPLSWYREIYIRDKYKCAYCDRELHKRFDDWMSIQIDHIIPISKGGSAEMSNRVTSCNNSKHAFLPDNHDTMNRDELLKSIRTVILKKRLKWKDEYKKALEEYGNPN